MNDDVFGKYKIDFNEIQANILESFVKIYGEENRSIIENRMKKIYVNTYITKENLKSFNNHRLTKKRDELTIKFLEQVGEKISDEDKNKVLKEGSYYLTENLKQVMKTSYDSNNFTEGNYSPICSFGKEIEENEDNAWRNQSILRDRCKVLNSLGLEINPDNYNEIVNLKSSKNILERAELLYEASNNCNEQFEKYKEEIKEDLDYIEDCDKLEAKIRDEETIEFYKEISPYLNENEQKKINEALNLGASVSLYKFKDTADKENIYLNTLSTYGSGLLESFSKDSEKLISLSEKNKEYEISNIKKNRVKYFKSMGLDLGNEYENYTNDDKIQSLIPNIELSEKIKELRLKHIEKTNSKVLENTGSYNQNLNELAKLDLLVEDTFNQDFVNEGVICISPNLVFDKNKNIEMKNIVHIPVLGMLKQYEDVMFIHEIGHAVETSYSIHDDKNITFKTGFEAFEDKMLDENILDVNQDNKEETDDLSRRKYEFFSETIHQKIAMEITMDLHEKNKYIFDDPENSKVKGGTSYEHYNIIINKFYDKFKTEILNSRLNDNLDLLIKKVGKENFENLNGAVNEYSKLPYNKLMTDFGNKKDTELTRKALEIIGSSEQIVKDMEEYSKENMKMSEFEKGLKGNVLSGEKIVETDIQNINENTLSKKDIENEKDNI